MTALKTLLKIAQRRMDELGVEAARIVQTIEQLRMRHASILAREETELALAAQDMRLSGALPAYRARVKAKAAEVLRAIAEAEETLAIVRGRLSEAYQEKSKFEQLIEQETRRREAERAAREQAMLDEVAINRTGSSGK